MAALPISGDALRGEGTAKTPSPDAEGRMRLRDPGFAIGEDGDPAFSLTATSPGAVAAVTSFDAEMSYNGTSDDAYLTRKLRRAVQYGSAVRRLTPTEYERLQGFPDGWTDYGPDSRRYAALGDAVTVNVAEWIGRRILSHITQRQVA